MIKNIIFSISLCIFLIPSTSYAKTYKVALFIPGQSQFWTLVTNFMQEAANDLKIELRVYNAKSDHYLMVRQVEEAISGPDKVDAIVFQNFKKRAPLIIKLAEKAQVYAYLFNSPIHKKAGLGKPREKYNYWLGEMFPDDIGVAEILARGLIEEAKKKGEIATDGKVHLFGIGGRLADTASITRIAGLKNAITNRTDVIFYQFFFTDWGVKDGFHKCSRAIQRYPKTTVIWSANYKTTFGILDCVNQHQLVPGQDVFINSFGLMEDTLKLVAKGEIVSTTGGHYIESAWVLVQLYDYFHGIDFAEEGITTRTPMPIITKKNVGIFIKHLSAEKLSQENLRKIDFTRYSKKLNPKLKKYQFNLESIFSQL